MTTAFVTGASGFVGGALSEELARAGQTVRALARSPASADKVRARGAEAVSGDLDGSSEAELAAGLRGCDVVYHAGAVAETWGDAEAMERINVGGTARLLAAARAAGVRRFVHVSTEAVLVGGPPIVRANETRPRPARPIGLYPATKGRAEEKVLAANGGGLTAMIVRPRFVWGVGDTSVMPFILEAVRAGRFLWIGGGHHLTSSCHIRNLCAGMRAAAERGRGGEIYFLGDGEPVELRGFLSELMRAYGVEPPQGNLPYGLAKAMAWAAELVWKTLGLKGAPPVDRTAVRLIGEEVTIDDGKARRELGYVPVMTRAQGLEELRACHGSMTAPTTVVV
jgi:nucleoside-diphosphate-sugar epimerase